MALFRDLAIARADGSLRSLLVRISRIEVLVIDDWAMAPLAETERCDFWEICEDRYPTRSTILTSQLPVARWHEQIGDPTAAAPFPAPLSLLAALFLRYAPDSFSLTKPKLPAQSKC